MSEICNTYNRCEALEITPEPSLTFVSREAAEEVLEELNGVIRDYGQASVTDLMVIAGLTGSFTNNRYGWTNQIHLCIDSVRDGFLLRLPTPEVIEPVYTNAQPESTVEHPNHYQSETGLEAIDVIEAFTFDLTGVEAFDTGNALKYLCRWNKKNGVEDLKKAQWYINHLIKHIENLEKENNNND